MRNDDAFWWIMDNISLAKTQADIDALRAKLPEVIASCDRRDLGEAITNKESRINGFEKELG